MSGNPDFNKQYSYDAMSNKVIRSERRRRDEDDSNPTSLAGQISVHDIGSRVVKDKPQEPIKETIEAAPKPQSRRTQYNYISNSSLESILYYPTNEQTAHVFDLIMSEIRTLFPDSSHDTILSAADAVLEILKNEDLQTKDKKHQILELLDVEVSDLIFNELMNLAKNITDYNMQVDEEAQDGHEVAIEFDGDDDNDNIELGNQEEIDHESPQIDDNTETQQPDSLNTEEVIVQKLDEKTQLQVSVHDIDEFYLQRKVSKYLKDEDQAIVEAKTKDTQRYLSDLNLPDRDVENELLDLFEYDHLDLVTFLIENRWKLVFKTKWLQHDDKSSITEEMKSLHLEELLLELSNQNDISSSKRSLDESNDDHSANKKLKQTHIRQPRIIDLNSMTFDQGSHLMTKNKIKLPEGSYQQNKKLYDLIHIPPPQPPKVDEKLVPVTELPKWAQEAFPSNETTHFNRIQSRVFPEAFGTNNNLLICAPTGAGKTNVAMLTVLKAISNYRNETGKIDLKQFKIVYIAPLKALVQEQMREFQRRLTPTFGVVVNELTGDSSLTKQQISETQIIVTTPEKWDIITRKNSEYTNLTRLIIIDEIHLLHDERGSVLESIVSRTIRKEERTNEPVRLVGLSATLPNFEDVAKFLKVDLQKGLFYFDASYRPCPLQQQYIGIKEKKAIKKINAMNEACFDKLVECLDNKHQLIIFVHSRNDTYKTAKWLRDKLNLEERQVISNPGSIEILKQEAEDMTNRNLKDIIPSGIGIHHAGLNKGERSVVEDLFAQGHVQVLVSTATLAWGVNLPAHTVIIKGTETYSPSIGSWVQLSPQDILQMLGRAGRPRYDKSGEGVIITSQEEIQYYLAILNQQLPIESQLIGKLVDTLNGEIVLGTVRTREEAITWLGYTYLYIRMLRSPGLYHVGAEYADDKALYWKRCDLVHSALSILHQNQLVTYDSDSGEIKPTELGRISSYFYINYSTMNMFNTLLKPWMSEIEILKIFSSSGEFKYIPVRQEERLEISKLVEKCPIPIKESPSDPLAKVNVLLQTYISRLTLDGFALMADMVYITQSAGRLLRAMHEIALQKKWSSLSKVTLNLCKMVERRMWLSNSPFRQFGSTVPKEIIRTTENSHLPFVSYCNLDASELAEALNFKGSSHRAYELLKQFPKLNLGYYVQPITPSLLRVLLEILPQWNWNTSLHGGSESFMVIVEDCNGENILYFDTFTVSRKYIGKEHLLEFFIPILQPLEPTYFVTFISEKWLHSEWKLPLMLNDIKVPKQFPAFTEVLSLQNISTASLKDEELVKTFDFDYFNKYQSQVFANLYKMHNNVFIGLSKGGGKTACAELAILKNWKENRGRIVYINPVQETVDELTKLWSKKYQHLDKVVGSLTGELSNDLATMNSSHLILSTPENFDAISRRWRQRKVIQAVDLFVIDDVHSVGNGSQGTKYETIIARMKFIAAQLEREMRIVALSTPLANGRDFGEWIGCSKQDCFNFSPENRFNRIKEIRLQSSPVGKTMSTASLIDPSYVYLKSNKQGRSIVFVSTRKDCVDVANEYIQKAASDNWHLLEVSEEELSLYLNKVTDLVLRECLASGVGYFHPDMNPIDRLIVKRLFQNNLLSILLCTKDSCYFSPTASNVVILGTQEYDGKEHRKVDYSINEMLEMVGCCKDDLNNEGNVLIFSNHAKLNFYKKFFVEGLPIESGLNNWIHDSFMYEISTRTFKTRQDCIDWITFTYFYRRLQLNPSFYDVKTTTHSGISEYLSELVETTLNDLVEAKLVDFNDPDEENEDEDSDEEQDELEPTNTSMIAAHYSVSFKTMRGFNSLDNKTKLKGLLYCIASASEFEDIPIRDNEEAALSKVYHQVPIKIDEDYESGVLKTFILLQAYFSRIKLPIDLANDCNKIIEKVLPIVYACVDTLSSEGYLNALNVMDISQMIVQGVWNRDTPLKQLPNINNGILSRATKYNVETVYDIMTLEDEERDDLLQMEGVQLQQIAEFVNKYPNIEATYKLDLSNGPVVANEPHEIVVTLTRDEEVEDLQVVSAKYLKPKLESWWVVIGDFETKQLYAIKKTTMNKQEQDVKLQLTIPNGGNHQLSIWCICDSYVDSDKEISLALSVEQP